MTKEEILKALQKGIPVYSIDDNNGNYYEDFPVKEAIIRKVYIQYLKCNNELQVYVSYKSNADGTSATIWMQYISDIFLTPEEAQQEAIKRYKSYIEDLRWKKFKIDYVLKAWDERNK